MELGIILIYIAGFIWTIELIPQLIKTYKTKDVEGISLLFFIGSTTAYLTYMVGNGFLNNWSIVIAHIPSLLLMIWMVTLIFKYRRNNEKTSRKLNEH